jgi:hypothetical protein
VAIVALLIVIGGGRKLAQQLSPYDKWKASQHADAAEGHQLVNQKAR